MLEYVDLRSDTVTKPCEAMRTAMAKAPVGDDVMEEDESINELQSLAAAMLDRPAALFFPSGTQSNLCALMAHCERGDEYLCGQHAHVYKYEAGGAAVLGSIQPQPLQMTLGGEVDLTQAQNAIKDDDVHYAKSKLFCLENTHYGYALTKDYTKDAVKFARENNLALHMDGARLFNASVHNNVDPKELVAEFDTVSICLSKGLGAPVGSLLLGSEDIIDKTKRIRKMVGGGMRQAGIVAAAGIYALQNNVKRLSEDHQKAAEISSGIDGLEHLECWSSNQQTNMVFMRAPKGYKEYIINFMEERGFLIGFFGQDIRLVLHKDIKGEAIPKIIQGFKELSVDLKNQIKTCASQVKA